jgi:hypothetical protein
MRVKPIHPVDVEIDEGKSDELQISSDSDGSEIFEFVSNMKSLDSVTESKSSNDESISIKDSQFDVTDDTKDLFTNSGDFFRFDLDSKNYHTTEILPTLLVSVKANSSKEEFLNYWALSAPSSLGVYVPNYTDLLERAIFADDFSEITEIIENPKNVDNEAVTFLSKFINTLTKNNDECSYDAKEHIGTHLGPEKEKIEIIVGEGDKKGLFLQFEETKSPSILQETSPKVNDFKSSDEESGYEPPNLPSISDNTQQAYNNQVVSYPTNVPELKEIIAISDNCVVRDHKMSENTGPENGI